MPTSRARERGMRTARANGVAAAVAITTGGLRRNRRRSNGAARPAASTVQAAARMAVERGTDFANISRGTDGSGTGNRPLALQLVPAGRLLHRGGCSGGFGGEGA